MHAVGWHYPMGKRGGRMRKREGFFNTKMQEGCFAKITVGGKHTDLGA